MFVSKYTNVHTDIGYFVRDKCKYILLLLFI